MTVIVANLSLGPFLSYDFVLTVIPVLKVNISIVQFRSKISKENHFNGNFLNIFHYLTMTHCSNNTETHIFLLQYAQTQPWTENPMA